MNKAEAGYRGAIGYLYGLQKYGIKFGLSKTSNLLEALGNPHHGQNYIHIAGTNGKGSVAAFIASILTESGLKVGLYTSPHLVRFTERFKINNEEISRETATALIEALKQAVRPEEPPTFFEATTAMALAFFAREKTDIAVMEVGMGGRLDATNVISPLLSVITNISMEHQFFLGSRLLDIAVEKGGIIKNGVDVVTGAGQPGVIHLFESICRERKTRIWRLGKDFQYRATASGLHYYGIKRRLHGLEPGLRGRFQNRNATVALASLERLEAHGFHLLAQHIRNGLQKSRWPGRMQVVSGKPTIVLDGAHNPAAVRALSSSIRSDLDYRRLILVIGVMEDKDIGRMLKGIVPLSDYVIYTRPVYARAAEPEVLLSKGAPLGKPGEIVPRLTDAIEKAKQIADPQALIVICGSLFTVGEAMTHFDSKTYRPDEL